MIDEIVRAKPAAAKGRYILSITLATTMGPGVRVDTARTREAEILHRLKRERRAAATGGGEDAARRAAGAGSRGGAAGGRRTGAAGGTRCVD